MALVCGRLSGNPDIVKASANAPPIRMGARGEGVRVLQMALIDLGASMPRSTGGSRMLPDGMFGAETHAAVVQFQRLNGLSPDGVAGAQTIGRLDMLLAAKAEAAARTARQRGETLKGMG